MSNVSNKYRKGGFIVKKVRPNMDLPDLGVTGRDRHLERPLVRTVHSALSVLAAVLFAFALSFVYHLIMLVNIGMPWGKALKFPLMK